MMTIASTEFAEGMGTGIEGAAGGTGVILALTDGGREPAYRRSFAVALDLARRTGSKLLLVDRSQETWGDTPHHLGPFTPEALRERSPRGWRS